MPDRILPPATRAASVASTRVEPGVPAGWPGTYCPNFSEWRLGDIVLVHGDDGLAASAIRLAQRTSANAATKTGHRCTHAAIYVGDGLVVDATKGLAVRAQSVWNYCQTRALQVRGLRDPRIPAADTDAIAACARRHVGEPYSMMEAILSRLYAHDVPNRDALYCSTLAGLVVAEATGVDLSSSPEYQPLHPGTLAAHGDLRDVMLEWRSL